MQIYSSDRDAVELDGYELEAVSGGMKITSGYRSADVIDGRGGDFSFGGVTVTLDAKGHISSYGPTP